MPISTSKNYSKQTIYITEDEKCSVCGGRIVKTPEGELVCSSCGLVKGYIIILP